MQTHACSSPMAAMGTLFAVMTVGCMVTRFDETSYVKFRASTSRFPLALDDQLRVLMGGSFRATEKFSLPRFHKAVIQLAASDPHC